MKIRRKYAELAGYTFYNGERITEWRCPDADCGMHVSEDYTCCPYCGRKIKFRELLDVPIMRIRMRNPLEVMGKGQGKHGADI